MPALSRALPAPVQAFDGIPTRPKNAACESVNTPEAVLTIITKRKEASLGDAAADLTRDPASPRRGALDAALTSLSGDVLQLRGPVTVNILMQNLHQLSPYSPFICAEWQSFTSLTSTVINRPYSS